MRMIGPNCLGVMNPIRGLNATFAATIARPGNVAFISQSGALCTAVLDWSLRENVGFSAFVSIGSMLDVGWGDLIDLLRQRSAHQSHRHLHGVHRRSRSLPVAAREVSLTKPIIVIKAGRTAAAAKAAASHTGSLTGSDDVLDAAFRRVGVLRVNSHRRCLLHDRGAGQAAASARATACASSPTPAVPGVLATDALMPGGGELAELSPETHGSFNKFLPAAWSHDNPVDILGDAEPERYAKSLEIAAQGPAHRRHAGHHDAAGHDRSDAHRREAEALCASPGQAGAGELDGRRQVAAGEQILNRAGIPTFQFPDTAVRRLQLHVEVCRTTCRVFTRRPRCNTRRSRSATARSRAESSSTSGKTGRTILTEYESKQLLEAYGIPTTETAHRQRPRTKP